MPDERFPQGSIIVAGKGTIPDCDSGVRAPALEPLGFDHGEEETAFDGAERVEVVVEIGYEFVEFVAVPEGVGFGFGIGAGLNFFGPGHFFAFSRVAAICLSRVIIVSFSQGVVRPFP